MIDVFCEFDTSFPRLFQNKGGKKLVVVVVVVVVLLLLLNEVNR